VNQRGAPPPVARAPALPSDILDFPAVTDPTDIELRLLALIRAVRYGHVQIVKHEGRILTADPTQKVKFG
jgi:hypothetical protein